MNRAELLAWVETIVRAIAAAVADARDAGLSLPGERETAAIASAVNDAIARSLQVQVVGLAALVQISAAKAIAEIDSLPKDPMCPRCGKPLRQFTSVSPGVPNPPGTPRVLKCDDCGWSLP